MSLNYRQKIKIDEQYVERLSNDFDQNPQIDRSGWYFWLDKKQLNELRVRRIPFTGPISYKARSGTV